MPQQGFSDKNAPKRTSKPSGRPYPKKAAPKKAAAKKSTAKRAAPKRAESDYEKFYRALRKEAPETYKKMIDNFNLEVVGAPYTPYEEADALAVAKVMAKHKISKDALPGWAMNPLRDFNAGLSGDPNERALDKLLPQLMEQLNPGAGGGAPGVPDVPLPAKPPEATPAERAAAVAQFFGGPIQPQVNAIGDQLRGTGARLDAIAPGAGQSVGNLATALQGQPQATAQFAAALDALRKMAPNNGNDSNDGQRHAEWQYEQTEDRRRYEADQRQKVLNTIIGLYQARANRAVRQQEQEPDDIFAPSGNT